MNILIPVCDGGYPMRGAVYYIYNYLKALSKIDKKNTYYILIDKHQKNFLSFKSENFNIITVDTPNNRLGIHKWYVKNLYQYFNKYKCDLLFLMNTFVINKKIKKFIFLIHDLAEFENPKKHGFLKSLIRRLIIRHNLKKSNIVLTVSNFSKQLIVKHANYNPDNIFIASPGVDIEYYKTKSKAKMPLDLINRIIPDKYFLYVGAIESTKNIETLINALSYIVKKDEKYNLVLAGGFGDAIGKIKTLVEKLNLNDYVFFTGYLDDDVLLTLFQNALSLVHPSLMEGYGMILTQAMASGIPVIASNATAFPEVVGDAGILVEPKSIIDMAEAMESLYDNFDLRNEYIKKGIERVKSFTWEKAANVGLNAFEKILCNSVAKK